MTAELTESCVSIAPQIVWRDVEGDLILFDEQSGQYHTLNASASFVWRRLAQGFTPAAVIAEASAPFPERADAIAADVHTFIASALQLGLLRT